MDPDGETAAVAVGTMVSSLGGYTTLSATGLGVILVAGAVAVTHVGSGDGTHTVAQWWTNEFHTLFSKGGKQNVRDTGLQGVSDQEIERELANLNIPKSRKKRLQKEPKARNLRNRQKRKNTKCRKPKKRIGVVHPRRPDDPSARDHKQPQQREVDDDEDRPLLRMRELINEKL